MSTKYVYRFGKGKTDGDASMKELLGGKGANLAEMSNLEIPVPAGFTISTEVCSAYYENDGNFEDAVKDQVAEGVEHIEEIMGAKFGDPDNPLLVSVRSGAPASMPGMMDTVLNLGLNETTIQGIIKQSNNERFAWDSYRRFVQMYGDVVLGMKPETKEEEDPFEIIIEKMKQDRGVENDTELTADDLMQLVTLFKDEIKKRTGSDFPTDPWEQLWGSIGAVFDSWNNQRALTYRKLNNIPAHWGTAVNVQAMVFGNMGDDCATGVAFTRDPATGENKFYGEYLVNAQGEDVVAGIRTPQPVNEATKNEESQKTLQEIMPNAYAELETIYQKLENHYKDMQDIEFTIQHMKKVVSLGARVHGHAFLPLPGTPYSFSQPGRVGTRLRREINKLMGRGYVFGQWEKQEVLAARIAELRKRGVILITYERAKEILESSSSGKANG